MPVTIEIPKEKWTGKVREITLGATAAEGGTRAKTVTVGGETTLPFLHFEGAIPNAPKLAIEIKSRKPAAGDWSPLLIETWGAAMDDPGAWAKAAEAAGADLILLTLTAQDTPDDARAAVKKVLGATGLPLAVFGPGQAEKDNELDRARGRSGRGRKTAAGRVRGQELPHHRRGGAGARPPGRQPHADGREPVQAAHHPHQGHGHAARTHHPGSEHRRAGLWHRVRLLGDGAPAPGRAGRRRHDATAHARHRRAKKPGRSKSPKWAKASRRPGASGRNAPPTGRRSPLPRSSNRARTSWCCVTPRPSSASRR